MTDSSKWPSAVSDTTTLKDRLDPTVEFLRSVELLPKEASAESGASSADVIRANTLAITEKTQKSIKWGSVGGAGAGTVAAVGSFISNASDLVTATIFLGVAIVIASGLLGLARVMDGDVRGRSASVVAVVERRAETIEALLQSFDLERSATSQSPTAVVETAPSTSPTDNELLLCLSAFPNSMTATTQDGSAKITGIKWSAGEGLEVKLENGDLVRPSRISGFRAP